MRKLLRCVSALSIIWFISILLLCGCNAPRNQLSKFNTYFQAGDLERARAFAEKKIHSKGCPRGEDVLWSLQAASIDRMQKNYDQSTAIFDSCEEMMTHFDAENSELGHSVGAVVVNDNVVPYTGKIYDGVMVNTYKALNFMSTGQYDQARVEFNRALDRQRRAKEAFNKEIQKLKSTVNTDQNSKNIRQSLDNSDLKARLQEVYPSLYDFSVYPDFVNPFATYMAGLFFLVEGDYAKSVDLLKESAGMMPDNTVILQDLDRVERALSKGKPIEPAVWVIFENGLGPVKEEVRMDLPLFIATNNVRYVGIALPQLVFRPAASPYLEIRADSETSKTQLVSNMDWVIQTEFNKDFKGILTRAVISMTAKAIAQYQLEQDNRNNGGDWAAVAMAIYSAATTAADVRIWTTLPKNIQVARLAKPRNGLLTITAPTIPPIPVKIADCEYAIVYVRMLSAANPPSIEVMTFN